ncbi:MAG TPA: GntG family PLP-dependent aldolase [Chitinophagaceae bacterium]|nr:GntG family PLP-dependent aldolase [Chitinophagaceae bacterium]
MIDYRSDTFTKPSPPMLEAMFRAKVGDDVFEEDPSVNQLQAFAADLFGMEAGLFCPSGTMTNQVAIKCHTQPGDEVICDRLSHIYIYEGGGIAFNSGCQVKPVAGDRGRISAEQVKASINPNDVHKPVSKLVSLENTANRGGGSCYTLEEIMQIKEVCVRNDLKLHLDGARIFNALAETKEKAKDHGKIFDSISVCLSKGLGAPVGSVLLGNKSFIQKARRVRKVFGGGMRQAGFLAAAGLYALQNNISRLHIDHLHAKKIAEALLKKSFIGKMMPVETNILIFEVQDHFTPVSFAEKLKQHDILVMPISESQVRMVLHLDVTESMVNDTIGLIHSM